METLFKACQSWRGRVEVRRVLLGDLGILPDKIVVILHRAVEIGRGERVGRNRGSVPRPYADSGRSRFCLARVRVIGRTGNEESIQIWDKIQRHGLTSQLHSH